MLAGGMFPGWSILLAPCFEALLWPLVTLLLLAPQRRAPDPDQNRPL
jgi:rod shape-determining protein MreD